MNDFSTRFCAAIALSLRERGGLRHRRRAARAARGSRIAGGHDRVDQRRARSDSRARRASPPARRACVPMWRATNAPASSSAASAGAAGSFVFMLPPSRAPLHVSADRASRRRRRRACPRARPASAGLSLNSHAAYASSLSDSGVPVSVVVDRDHLAGDRRVDVAGGLHRLDDRAGLARLRARGRRPAAR